MLNALRPAVQSTKAQKELANDSSIGGMRDPSSWKRSIPFPGGVHHIRAIIERELDQSNLQEFARLHEPDQNFDRIQQELDSSGIIARIRGAITPGCSHPGGLSPVIIKYFNDVTGDPDTLLPTWLTTGAPLGINRPVTSVGIFPPALDDPEVSLPDLLGLGILDASSNYTSADDNPRACSEILDKMVSSGWAVKCCSIDELRSHLGHDVAVINKLGLISKPKPDGTTKHRIVWDMSESGVNSQIIATERIVLPRPSDVVASVTQVQSLDGIEFFGIDISDAFHQVPLHEAERRFTAAEFQGEYFVFVVLVFGSRSAPTVWGRFAAWLGRSTAAITRGDLLRVHTYVDDPLYILAGPPRLRRRELQVALLWALSAGFPLAWNKAESGTLVRWIGLVLSVCTHFFTISPAPDKAESMAKEIALISKCAMISSRRLRKLCGSLSSVAHAIPVFRPFIDPLWAELRHTQAARGGHPGVIHTRRIQAALARILDLFVSHPRDFTKRYPLYDIQHCFRFTVVTDASPWGLGGILLHDGTIMEYFGDAISSGDTRRFRASRGDPAHMGIWEALAILVAIRCWEPVLASSPFVTLRADNLGIVYAYDRLRSRCPHVSKILRETAYTEAFMCSGLGVFNVVTHIPGFSNSIADALSRLHAPSPKPIPPEVSRATRVFPISRDESFWH